MEDKQYQQIIQKFKQENETNYELGKIRKVFTECLIKQKGYNEKRISWNENIGKLIYFIYNNIEGYIEIIDCIKHTKIIKIRYNNKQLKINKTNFINGNLGEILGIFTSDFKVKIGTKYQDGKRDIVITDMEIRKDKSEKVWKWYKYTCNNCGWTKGWMPEGSLIGKQEVGCSCCNGKIVVEGINDIPTVAPFIVKYFQNPNEAKLYTKYGGGNPNNPKGYISPTCPDCGRTKNKKMRISDIYRRKNISCSCSDNQPYTEKLIFNVLEQLQVNFEYHKTFEWSKDIQVDNNIGLCGRKEYDFYLVDYNIVIETHGIQHYKKSNRGRSLEIEQANDFLKEELALKNGIKENNYIVLDCRYSELEFIKQNILKSRLSELFNLTNIDWFKAEEFALSNRVKKACDYKRDNPNMTTTEIGRLMNLDRQIIRKYLSKGEKLNWCEYNAEVESKKIIDQFISNNTIEVICVEKEIKFSSMKQCSELSEEIFGIKLSKSGISRACKSNLKPYKGYRFMYYKDYLQQQSILNKAI